jgi:DNA-binding MarR family transcriptional regulator
VSTPSNTPVNPDPARDDADQILRSLRAIMRAITIHSKRLFRDTGLTLPQILCLRAIDAAEAAGQSVTAAAVSRTVHLSAATVTGIVDRLERSKLIERRRDTKDRRRVYLSLTPKGQEWLSSIPTNLQDRVMKRLRELPGERRAMMLEVLEELLDILGAGDLDTSPILTSGEHAANLPLDLGAAFDLPAAGEEQLDPPD